MLFVKYDVAFAYLGRKIQIKLLFHDALAILQAVDELIITDGLTNVSHP